MVSRQSKSSKRDPSRTRESSRSKESSKAQEPKPVDAPLHPIAVPQPKQSEKPTHVGKSLAAVVWDSPVAAPAVLEKKESKSRKNRVVTT